MFLQKYKFIFAKAICLFIFFSSYSILRVSGKILSVANPHALNLQQRYNNELNENLGKVLSSKDGSESSSGSMSLDGESPWQRFPSSKEAVKGSINYQDIARQFPSRYLSESILRYPDLDRNHASQTQLMTVPWEGKNGKYSSPVLLKLLNHPNGWIYKPDELINSRGLFQYDEKRPDVNPQGGFTQLRNINGLDGTWNSDSPSNTFGNDMVQKRNSNPGFICHFKLCQLASGKRRFNPGAWSFNGDHDY